MSYTRKILIVWKCIRLFSDIYVYNFKRDIKNLETSDVTRLSANLCDVYPDTYNNNIFKIWIHTIDFLNK